MVTQFGQGPGPGPPDAHTLLEKDSFNPLLSLQRCMQEFIGTQAGFKPDTQEPESVIYMLGDFAITLSSMCLINSENVSFMLNPFEGSNCNSVARSPCWGWRQGSALAKVL